jgi:hypothetical protein
VKGRLRYEREAEEMKRRFEAEGQVLRMRLEEKR